MASAGSPGAWTRTRSADVVACPIAAACVVVHGHLDLAALRVRGLQHPAEVGDRDTDQVRREPVHAGRDALLEHLVLEALAVARDRLVEAERGDDVVARSAADDRRARIRGDAVRTGAGVERRARAAADHDVNARPTAQVIRAGAGDHVEAAAAPEHVGVGRQVDQGVVAAQPPEHVGAGAAADDVALRPPA